MIYNLSEYWWCAQAKNPNQFAVGSGDCEVMLVTNQDQETARQMALCITKHLNNTNFRLILEE